MSPKDSDEGTRKPVRRLVRRRTAAEELDVSISMLKRLERDGRLTPIRLGSSGRDVFYSVSDIEALVDGESATS